MFFYYDIDNLQGIISRHLAERVKEKKKAEKLIRYEVEQFCEALKSLKLEGPAREISLFAEDVIRQELAKTSRQLREFIVDEGDREKIEYLVEKHSQAVLKKFLQPIFFWN